MPNLGEVLAALGQAAGQGYGQYRQFKQQDFENELKRLITQAQMANLSADTGLTNARTNLTQGQDALSRGTTPAQITMANEEALRSALQTSILKKQAPALGQQPGVQNAYTGAQTQTLNAMRNPQVGNVNADTAQRIAQTQTIDAMRNPQVENLVSDTDRNYAQVDATNWSIAKDRSMFGKEKEQLQSNINLTNARQESMDWETARSILLTPLEKRKMEAGIGNILAETDATKAATYRSLEMLGPDVQLRNAEVARTIAQTGNINEQTLSEIMMRNSRIRQLNAEALRTEESAKSIRAERELLPKRMALEEMQAMARANAMAIDMEVKRSQVPLSRRGDAELLAMLPDRETGMAILAEMKNVAKMEGAQAFNDYAALVARMDSLWKTRNALMVGKDGK